MPRNDVSRYRVISSRNRWLLRIVLILFALLAVNSVYLAGITLLEYARGSVYQDYFYLIMFLVHLVLGLLLVVPFVAFAWQHARRAIKVDNRYAIRAGLALFLTSLMLLGSGILLTRFGFFEINDPAIRQPAYWLHVLSPLLIAWLFILHRLAGRPIRYRHGLGWGALAIVFAAVMAGVHFVQESGPAPVPAAEAGFTPSLTRTASGAHIPAAHLMTDEECAECHADIARGWETSMHRHSSFTNPAYRFSVEETRELVMQRDGNMHASRFCAACHDVVPLVSGRFDQADFDPDSDPSAMAGLTCTSCHAITRVGSTRGTGDYVIQDPPRYPFARSDSKLLKAVNRQLIRAKPAYHKKSLLKPHHTTAEFCSTCHKTHLPEALNHYKWLRGQNHYDSFIQSGVSGHKVDSFYYPLKAVEKCADCHMPLQASDDPAARDFDGSGRLTVHNHQFPAANTAVPYMLDLPDSVNEAHRQRLKDIVRVDLFGLRHGTRITEELIAPLRPERPTLRAGESYLIDAVIRTTGVGHMFTQGTSDSNQLWLDISVYDGERLIARSGGRNAAGEVDPWSYFVNSYVLDREGNRIDRRNAQDIFVALYNHQIPPGAASVVHYALRLPRDVKGPVAIEAELKYRKFDTAYLRYIEGEDFESNTLPVTTMASDRVVLPVGQGSIGTGANATGTRPPAADEWERWNDYGIGLLRAGSRGSAKGELRQAEQAFRVVESLNPAHGALNLARVYYKEGRLQDATAALQRAKNAAAPPWTLAWFSALVDHENGHLDKAIETLEHVADTRFEQARERGFDFSRDVNLLNELGRLYYERARIERGADNRGRRRALLASARSWFLRTLEVDPEDLTSHFNLALVYKLLGDDGRSAHHREAHNRYRPDDHAIEIAATRHRQSNPAADHAASAGAVYDLNRHGAYGLSSRAPSYANRADTSSDTDKSGQL